MVQVKQVPDAPLEYILVSGSGTGILRRENKINLLEAALTFAGQLQDAERPRACPSCLQVYARAISNLACEDALSYVLTHAHSFWDACARVASFHGAKGDLTVLRDVLDANMRTCQASRLHVHANGAVRDYVARFMDALCRCLAASLRGGSHKKQQNVFLSKHGMWPTTPESIMPYGVSAYARWTCMIPTRYPLALLARLTVVARRTVMVDLLRSPSRERILVTIVRILRHWHVPPGDIPAAFRDLVVDDFSLGRPCVEESTSAFGLVVHFISVFQTGPDRYLDDFANFARGFERQLHDAIMSAATSAMWTDDAHVDCLLRAASSLCSIAGLPVHSMIREFRDSPEVQQSSCDGLSVGDAIYVYLQQKLDSRFCSGPGCRNLSRETDKGRHALSLCGNCKVMRYCGIECQRRDWSVGNHGAPHKTICSAVCKFIDAGLLTNKDKGMSEFSQAYFDLGFLTMSEYSALGRLALVDDTIPRHIQIAAMSQMMGMPYEVVAADVNAAIEEHRRSSAHVIARD